MNTMLTLPRRFIKSTGRFLLILAIIVAGALLVSACKEPDTPIYPAPPNIVGPEYGLFWFGKDDANKLALPGEENPYYDPENPTIIFVHGWKPDQGYSHRTMIWKFEDESGQEREVDMAAAWVDAGWNIGVFDWGPFSDEPIVTDAEAKIWTTEGGEGMRWRDREGEYRTDNTIETPIKELFYGALVQALADFRGPELRIAGHSLGNQIVVGGVNKLLSDIDDGQLPSQLLPTQVILLDPYWSPVVHEYLGERSTGATVRQIIKDKLLPRNILISWYRSSLMTEGILVSDANPALLSLVSAYILMDPAYCALTDQVCRHDAAWESYFYSFAFAPPKECVRPEPDADCEPTGEVAFSASTPVERLREVDGKRFGWDQVLISAEDHSTITRRTDDDWYERRDGDHIRK
jgi:hypothetical protein